MFSLSFLTLVLAADPTWNTDYKQAYRQARESGKDLFICFQDDDTFDEVLRDAGVRERLNKVVCLKVPTSTVYQGKNLLEHACFEDMLGRSGLAIVSLCDKDLPYYGEVVSAHPLVQSHYAWAPNYGANEVKIILDLPGNSNLTQRSMIYAIRVHPERPQSVWEDPSSAFLAHAAWHSQRQADAMNQHHADIIGASYWLESQVGRGISSPSEVVAESWGQVVGGENVLEASFSCVDAWRHSSGHWGAVARFHRLYGYDVAKSGNGTWYATGIFAD